jgi:hypothetical protein
MKEIRENRYAVGGSRGDRCGDCDVYSDLINVSAGYRKTIWQIFLKLHSNVSPDVIHECIHFGDSDIDGDSDIAA